MRVLLVSLLVWSSGLFSLCLGFTGSGSGAATYCLDAGLTRCCEGRDDSCLGNPAVCYCDEFCISSDSGDCCPDLVEGLLPCGATDPSCANTVEDRAIGLAELHTVISESAIGQPDDFSTPEMYIVELQQVVVNLFLAFDKDGSNALEEHEFHLLYVAILSDFTDDDTLDLCEFDFKTFCDDNSDGVIQLSELGLCTGANQYCMSDGQFVAHLARELLVAKLQPIFRSELGRSGFRERDFVFADLQDPKGMLSLDEFNVLYGRLIVRYNVLPSVCVESVFELCNSDDDLFVSEAELFACGS